MEENLDDINDIQVLKEKIITQRQELVNLNNKLSDLEDDNEILLQRSEKIKSEKEQIANMENQIAEHDEKITGLNELNSELRAENTELREKIEIPSEDNLTKITDLEEKIREQNEYVASLINENRELLKKLETSHDDESKTLLEDNTKRLQKKIAILEKENKEQGEKNQVLKAALLLHMDIETKEVTDTKIKPISPPISEQQEIRNEELTQIEVRKVSDRVIEIPKGKVQEMIKQRQAEMEANKVPEEVKTAEISTSKVQELILQREAKMESIEVLEEDKIAEVSTSKVHELILQREVVIEERETTKQPQEIVSEQEIEETIEEKKELLPPTPEEISEPVKLYIPEVPDIENIGVIETPDGKRKCPVCGNESHRLIREVIDKAKIISAYPRMYGKKFKCGQCGAEWR